MVGTLALGLCLAMCSEMPASDFAARREHNWHQWRGPNGGGIAPHADPPIVWGPDRNVKWAVEIPGEGSATPIVWEDRVFVLTALRTDRVAPAPPRADAAAKTEPPRHYYQFIALCLDRATGRTLWQRVATEEVPHEGRHATNTYASASPTTDGGRLYASFGSRGIFCFDREGRLLWQRDLGDMRTRFGWGEASSPVVHAERLIVNWDHEDQSFIEVLNAATGETVWKSDRDEPTSWATPLVVEHQGRTQVIVNGTNRVRSYDLASGEVIWQCGGQTVNAIPSPIAAGRAVICMSGYRGAAALAIPLDAAGDITGTRQIVWSHFEGTPYVPSPILQDGRVYFTRGNTGVLSCLDAVTGKPVFSQMRLPALSNVYASPSAAAGRIYFVGRDGVAVVLRSGPKPEVLAVNKLVDPMDASPVLVGRQLFLRGERRLYCIEEQ